jgi:hypothetical protein
MAQGFTKAAQALLKEEARRDGKFLFRAYSKGVCEDCGLCQTPKDVEQAFDVWLQTPGFTGLLVATDSNGRLYNRVEVL